MTYMYSYLLINYCRGVWGHAPLGKNFKIRHSEIVSVAREVIEPNYQK